jgi:molybdopterin-biosynthesis enzyme MoeA-like protein
MNVPWLKKFVRQDQKLTDELKKRLEKSLNDAAVVYTTGGIKPTQYQFTKEVMKNKNKKEKDK